MLKKKKQLQAIRELVPSLLYTAVSISILTIVNHLFFKEKVNPPCPLCMLKPLHPPTSTERDVILAAALTKLKRVEFFLRTLRSTGSKARIILFVSRYSTISRSWRKFFKACNVEPVYVPMSNEVLDSAPKLSRYYYYQQWLSANIESVDRVLHTDTFDVIFQSDPFFPSINSSKLYFTFEPVTLASSHWTASWINQCYDEDLGEKFWNANTSCSGVTVGGARPFLKYLDILLSTPKWTQCFGHSLDQAHHNYLLHTGKFAEQGLEIEPFGCNSPYLTMHFCCKREKCHLSDEDIMYGSNNEEPPVLIHQYNRWKNLTARNALMCPNPDRGNFKKTRKGEMAEVVKLPKLQTNFPKITLQPP